MKVAFFTDVYLPSVGGIEINVDGCAKALRAAGVDVTIFAPRPLKKSFDDPPYVQRFSSYSSLKDQPLIPLFSLPLPLSVFQTAINAHFDVIHSHTAGSLAFLGNLIAQNQHIPHIHTFHCSFPQYASFYFSGKVQKKIFSESFVERFCGLWGNQFSCIVAPSLKMERMLIRCGLKKPVVVIPNGIETALFSSGRRGLFRRKHHIPDDAFVLLYVGRLSKEKNIELLITSFLQIHKQASHARLVLVGAGPHESALKSLVRRHKLTHYVTFAGYVPRQQLPDVYADGDLFVFASHTESSGIVMIEAAVSGLPIVAVKDDAFLDVASDGVNAYLSKANSHDFAAGVLRLIKNPSLLHSFSEASRKIGMTQGDISRQAHDLIRLYETVLTLPASTSPGFKPKSPTRTFLRHSK